MYHIKNQKILISQYSSLLFSGIGYILIVLLLLSCQNIKLASKELYIPPILEISESSNTKIIELEAKESSHIFTSKKAKSLAYNNESYLGPTIRYTKNDQITLKVKNLLNRETTVHQHGLLLPANADGNIHQIIAPQTTWEVQYTISQNAGTFWYHPHRMGTTATQVYFGLAGMIIIDDELTQSSNLPNTYGVDDIPLIIQDKVLSKSGQQEYQENMHTSRMGYVGDTVLINGIIQPVFHVSKNLVRLRILNASNFGIHTYSIQGVDMYLIGNGGSYFDQPHRVKNITLSTGERREILVDFSKSDRKTITMFASIHNNKPKAIMEFDLSSLDISIVSIPQTLPYQEKENPNINSNVPTREFALWNRGMSNGTSINGKSINPNRIDFTIQKNQFEKWNVSNISQGRGMGMMSNLPHSFHVHGAFFTVLSYNGGKVPIEMQGLQDTILVLPNDKIELLIAFEDYTGLFMYHCHLLEHEDAGMMGQFIVKD